MEYNKNKPDTAEYLSKDILEEDLLKTFAPFRIIEMFLGTCRVHGKHRFVTAPTTLQKTYTLLMLAIIYAGYYIFLIEIYGFKDVNRKTYLLILLMIGAQLMFYTVTMIFVRFCHNEDNVKFYLKLQKIDRVMKIDSNKIINSVIFKINIISVSVLAFIFFGLIGMVLTILNVDGISVVIVIINQNTIILEITHCSNLMIYFALRIRIITCVISNHLRAEGETIEVKQEQTFVERNFSKILETKHYDFRKCEIDVYLKEILRGYSIYRDLYKFQVSNVKVGFTALVFRVGRETSAKAVRIALNIIIETSNLQNIGTS